MKRLYLSIFLILVYNLIFSQTYNVFGISPKMYLYNGEDFVYENTYKGIIKIDIDLDNSKMIFNINDSDDDLLNCEIFSYKFYDKNGDEIVKERKYEKALKNGDFISILITSMSVEDGLLYSLLLDHNNVIFSVIVTNDINDEGMMIQYDKIDKSIYLNETILDDYKKMKY